MGNNGAEKHVKPEKRDSPLREQPNVHVYPDWAAVQAYYGAGAVPPPYFAPVSSGHGPHPYMWAPPQMMPPYGSPYAAVYPHGIYGHAATAMVATPLMLETPTRSGNDSSSGKKRKESDGHATPANGNGESAEDGGTRGQSQSTDSGTEGSYDRSDDSTSQEGQNESKRSCNGTKNSGKYGSEMVVNWGGETNRGNAMVTGIALPCPASLGSTPATTMETDGSHSAKANCINAAALKPSVVGIQGEREMKKEKRKQSNRESARRSRLRKQAEMEDLAKRVESLKVENVALRSEISKLGENVENLRFENATLMETLRKAQGQVGKAVCDGGAEDKKNISTENFLSRVNNSGSNDAHTQDGQDK